jgi:hypothetical protein
MPEHPSDQPEVLLAFQELASLHLDFADYLNP